MRCFFPTIVIRLANIQGVKEALSINLLHLPLKDRKAIFLCGMITPPHLSTGDEIRLIATSRWVEESMVKWAEKFVADRGFRCSRGKHLLAHSGQFAGDDLQRSEDFIAAYSDPNVKAIWVMRGGYGAQRLLPHLASFDPRPTPTWVIGFSDVTAIHGWSNNHDIASIHAPVISTIESTVKEDVEHLFQVLRGSRASIEWESIGLTLSGESQGALVGGNLSVLQTMVGTDSFPSMENTILFIEDVDEMLYHIDRMLLHLDRAGAMDEIGCLVVGGMTEMKDNTVAHGFSSENPYGSDVFRIIENRIGNRGIPVAYGLSAGHGERNTPLVLGAEVLFSVEGTVAELKYL